MELKDYFALNTQNKMIWDCLRILGQVEAKDEALERHLLDADLALTKAGIRIRALMKEYDEEQKN